MTSSKQTGARRRRYRALLGAALASVAAAAFVYLHRFGAGDPDQGGAGTGVKVRPLPVAAKPVRQVDPGHIAHATALVASWA